MSEDRADRGPRFQALATGVPVGIYELDPAGDCVFVNDHWCGLAGVTPDAALGRGWIDVIHPDDLEAVVAEWTAASTEHREFALEYRYLHSDGEVVWIAGRAVALRDDSGDPVAYLGTAVDVTDRKLAERKLAESARHFELSLDLVATCGFDGYFKLLNGAWERILGWTSEELLPNPFIEIVHRDDRLSVEAEVAKLAGGGTTAQFKVRVAASGGDWRWTEWSASPDVAAGLFYCVGRDITERMAVEDALGAERRQLADAQQIARVGSWEVNLTTGERTFSAQQFRNLGFSPDGPVPTREQIRERTHPDDREKFEAFVGELDAGATELSIDYRIVLPGGDVRAIEAQGHVVTEAGSSQRLMGTSRDVTAERDADRVKEEFFGLVSHELRTPLTSIIGYTELLTEIEAANLSPQGRRFVEVIERNSRRELSLVADLLLLTRVTAGTFEIERGRADLATIAESTLEAARPWAESEGVSLSLEGSGPATVDGDPHRLAQVVENLVSNAIKFTPAGGSVAVSVAAAGDRVSLEVRDTGIGVPAAELGKLFDRMYRAQEAERRHIQGTGLGLTIVKAIVDAHDAAISVESEPGHGTTFRVVLAAASEARPPVPDSGARSHGGKRILGGRVAIRDD